MCAHVRAVAFTRRRECFRVPRSRENGAVYIIKKSPSSAFVRDAVGIPHNAVEIPPACVGMAIARAAATGSMPPNAPNHAGIVAVAEASDASLDAGIAGASAGAADPPIPIICSISNRWYSAPTAAGFCIAATSCACSNALPFAAAASVLTRSA